MRLGIFGYDSVYTIRKRCFGILHTAAFLYVVDVCDDDRLVLVFIGLGCHEQRFYQFGKGFFNSIVLDVRDDVSDFDNRKRLGEKNTYGKSGYFRS